MLYIILYFLEQLNPGLAAKPKLSPFSTTSHSPLLFHLSSFRVFRGSNLSAYSRHSLRSAWSLPYGSRPPSRGGYAPLRLCVKKYTTYTATILHLDPHPNLNLHLNLFPLHVLHVLHGQRRFWRSSRGSPEPSTAAPRQPERSGVFREGLPNRRVLASLRLSHIQQQATLSLPCLGIYHWMRTIRLLRLRAKTTPLVRPSPPHPSA